MSPGIAIVAVPGIGEVGEADRVGALVAGAAASAGLGLGDDDIVCISQKAVSKAEGRVRSLADVEPSARARELAAELGKDPRMVELVLGESRRVVRAEHGVLIVETHGGWICANAGIDASNVPGADEVALLPLDADVSARRLRTEITAACGARPGVVVSDSFGRPWRNGQTDVAIGCAGVVVVDDWRGRSDAYGRELAATAIATADELACAADLARDKVSGSPAILIRGAAHLRTDDDGPGAAAAIQRLGAEDLFR